MNTESIFIAVILHDRSVIPDSAHYFASLDKAKLFVESTTQNKEGTRWEDHDEGKFVFGYGVEDGDVDEPLAVVFGIDTLEKEPE